MTNFGLSDLVNDDKFTKVNPSDTLAINERIKAMRAEGMDVTHFGFGQSPFPPHAEVILSFQNNALRSTYDPVKGRPELCALFESRFELGAYSGTLLDRISTLYVGKDGTRNPYQAYVAPGSKTSQYALFSAIANLRLLLPEASWVSYQPAAKLNGASITSLPTGYANGWKLKAADLVEGLKDVTEDETALLVLNSPSNPTGAIYTDQELSDIADVCRKNDVLVLSDEIYAGLSFSGECPSISSHYPEGTLVSSGIAKEVGAGGYRLGYLLIPDNLKALQTSYLGIASEMYSSVVCASQEASIAAYTSKAVQIDIRQRAAFLDHVSQVVFDTLQEAGLLLVKAEGGFYNLVDFSPYAKALEAKGITTSKDLCALLLKDARVALLHGEPFGVSAAHFSARLAYVDFDGKAVLESMVDGMSVEDAYAKHCGSMNDGLQRLADYFKDLS
ncbi:aminotransferase class I/II-fold pyridoxal phosphate-dependent enzyme [bacterium]|jgi:aspartate aminotransferase|nr:aminotransferase class I/II-fold pyridoxal phosphate-dependent enzyme [bacterium]